VQQNQCDCHVNVLSIEAIKDIGSPQHIKQYITQFTHRVKNLRTRRTTLLPTTTKLPRGSNRSMLRTMITNLKFCSMHELQRRVHECTASNSTSSQILTNVSTVKAA